MTFLRSFCPTSFSEAPHRGVIRVFHDLVKRSTIPQVERVKKNALSNLRGIVNALGALEDNGLKKITLLAFYFLARTPSSSTDKIPQISYQLPQKVRHSFGSQNKQVFTTVLATYCLLLLIHPNVLLDFGAPNPGRRHTACSRRRVGGLLGGLPLALEESHRRPRQMGVAETQMGLPMRFPGVSATDMDG